MSTWPKRVTRQHCDRQWREVAYVHVGVPFEGVIDVFHNSLDQHIHLLFRLGHFQSASDVRPGDSTLSGNFAGARCPVTVQRRLTHCCDVKPLSPLNFLFKPAWNESCCVDVYLRETASHIRKNVGRGLFSCCGNWLEHWKLEVCRVLDSQYSPTPRKTQTSGSLLYCFAVIINK